MASWVDIADKALDFLKDPNIKGLIALGLVLFFLGYTIPLGVLTWQSWENTNRLERAITALGQNCMHTVALKK